jgi:hypothetical protein
MIDRRFQAAVLEHKMVRETTGTVRGKDHIKFDEANHSYPHEDGYLVDRKPGDEEWRVYYEIDNFDQIAEPARTHLLNAEKERAAKGKLRFRIVSKDQYDEVQIGDKLSVGWRWRGNDNVEVVTAGKPLT